MAILSFKVDQLFTLLVPELVVDAVVGSLSFASEPNFVQSCLLIKSNFVVLMTVLLVHNPHPKRLVLLALDWHQTMAILLFELDQPFMFHFLPCSVMVVRQQKTTVMIHVRRCHAMTKQMIQIVPLCGDSLNQHIDRKLCFSASQWCVPFL
jgi:hypothetical protein